MTARVLTQALGGRWHGRYGMARCPVHADHTPSLKVSDDPLKRDGIDLVCFAGCNWRDVKAALRAQHLLQPHPSADHLKPSAPDQRAHRADQAVALFRKSAPIVPGSPGWRYFSEQRRLDLSRFGDTSHVLRWHAPSRAIVGLFRDLLTNEACGVHRTYLNSRNEKIRRKMLGRTRQAAIKLDRDDDVTLALHVGEGVETCLAARLLGHGPVWALGSAGPIARLPVLPSIEALHVLAEHDDGGKNSEAIQECAERWLRARREVYVCDPPAGDFNDLLGDRDEA